MFFTSLARLQTLFYSAQSTMLLVVPGGLPVAVCDKYNAQARLSQHANATYRNIVGRNMLCAFGHRVAMCCDMLGVVGSSLNMVKFEPTAPNTLQHFPTVWPNAPNMLRYVALACFVCLAGALWNRSCC